MTASRNERLMPLLLWAIPFIPIISVKQWVYPLPYSLSIHFSPLLLELHTEYIYEFIFCTRPPKVITSVIITINYLRGINV
jgi:hypothetical protein